MTIALSRVAARRRRGRPGKSLADGVRWAFIASRFHREYFVARLEKLGGYRVRGETPTERALRRTARATHASVATVRRAVAMFPHPIF